MEPLRPGRDVELAPGLRSGLPATLAGLTWREAARREPQAGACWAAGLGKGDEPKRAEGLSGKGPVKQHE